MGLSLIVAMATNRVIGRDGELPWYLPADLKHFKKLTLGNVVIMGRKTHESIIARLGKPLPKRRSLVLSRDPDFGAPGVEVASSLQQALKLAATKEQEREVFIIGGAAVFAEALPMAERLYLTRVHAEIEGDVFFPELDLGAWRLVTEEHHETDARHAFPFSFELYERS